jgi:UDP-N-acetylglucosamine 4,6-dehydratase
MVKALITGGNGFLGRGIMRRARVENWDWDITSMSRDESKIVRVNGMYPEVHTIKGDVTDEVDYLARLFRGHDIIIHAAANKLVDIGERTALEVVKNNVIGSQHVVYAAMKAGVKRVIGISTDKAVQPVNTYGMTKALMERMFQEADVHTDTEFVCARYGNVVGSTISIVLYFEQQLKELGYIKITDPDMTRFYMGVDEGIDTILYSLNHAKRGSVVITKMMAMSVASVARLALDMPLIEYNQEKARLTYGQSYLPEYIADTLKDPRVKVVGPRPGEKIHESLLHAQESVRAHNGCEDRYWELRPPTETSTYGTSFTVTSDNPPLGWMPFDRMRYLIEDAKSL